jgi:APA family basic amino acid/polyamine antiporter
MAASAASIFRIRKQTRQLNGTGIYSMRLYPLQPLVFIAAYIFVAVSIALQTRAAALTGAAVFVAFIILFFILQWYKKSRAQGN